MKKKGENCDILYKISFNFYENILHLPVTEAAANNTPITELVTDKHDEFLALDIFI